MEPSAGQAIKSEHAGRHLVTLMPLAPAELLPYAGRPDMRSGRWQTFDLVL